MGQRRNISIRVKGESRPQNRAAKGPSSHALPVPFAFGSVIFSGFFFQDADASHRSENDGCEPRDRDLSSLVADESARLMGEEPMVGQVN